MRFWRVEIVESERGFGQKTDRIMYFRGNEKRKATQYVRSYNNKNTSTVVPDWYMRADGPYPMELDDALIELIKIFKPERKRATSRKS